MSMSGDITICNGLASVREILPVPNFYFSAHCSGLFWNTICVVALITSTDCVEQSQDGLKQVLNLYLRVQVDVAFCVLA